MSLAPATSRKGSSSVMERKSTSQKITLASSPRCGSRPSTTTPVWKRITTSRAARRTAWWGIQQKGHSWWRRPKRAQRLLRWLRHIPAWRRSPLTPSANAWSLCMPSKPRTLRMSPRFMTRSSIKPGTSSPRRELRMWFWSAAPTINPGMMKPCP